MEEINSIGWHEKNLNHMKSYLESEREHLKRVQDKFLDLDSSYKKYLLQLETAKKEGKTKFDRERYLKKRNTQ